MNILGLSLLLVLLNQSISSASRVRFNPNAKVMYFGSDSGDDTTVASAVADCRSTTMRGPYAQSCASLALVGVLNAWKTQFDRILDMTTKLYAEFNTPASRQLYAEFDTPAFAAGRRTLAEMGEAAKEVGNVHRKMQMLYDTTSDVNATVLWSLITKLIRLMRNMQTATINVLKKARWILYTSHFTESADKAYEAYMGATVACFDVMHKRIAEAMEAREEELAMRDLNVESTTDKGASTPSNGNHGVGLQARRYLVSESNNVAAASTATRGSE